MLLTAFCAIIGALKESLLLVKIVSPPTSVVSIGRGMREFPNLPAIVFLQFFFTVSR